MLLQGGGVDADLALLVGHVGHEAGQQRVGLQVLRHRLLVSASVDVDVSNVISMYVYKWRERERETERETVTGRLGQGDMQRKMDAASERWRQRDRRAEGQQDRGTQRRTDAFE